MKPFSRLPAGVLFLAGLLCLCPAGCQQPPEDKGEEEAVAPVKAEAAEKVALGETTELLGATQTLPQHAAPITAALGGQVLWVLTDGKGPAVVEGQQVKKGQVIVQLDDRLIRANRAKTQAMLDDIAAQKKQADIALQLAQLERDRLEVLLPGGKGSSIPSVSRVELERAHLQTKDAEAKEKAVEAKEKALRADLDVLDVQLELHQLRAPITGHLGTVQAGPGQTLAVGTSVAEVVDLREIDVVCVAPPESVSRLALNQPAWLTIGQKSEEPAESAPKGKVVFIAVQAQPDTGNFLVKVRFPNPELSLRANLVARVQVQTQPEKKRLVVPEAAVLEAEDEPTVVIAEDVKKETNKEGKEEKVGKAKKLHATLGVRGTVGEGEHKKRVVEILGLEDPEEDPKKKEKFDPTEVLYIFEGGRGLHDDDPVRLEEEEKEAKDKDKEKGKEDKDKEDKDKGKDKGKEKKAEKK
jgi:RND family efflux transporter MFP subunit